MRIILTKDFPEMSQEAAAVVKNRLETKPDLVLGLATGSTPIGL